MTEPTPDRPAPRRPSTVRYRVAVTVALVVAAAALVAGVRATNTDDEGSVLVNGRPDVVEHLVPRDGAEVLRQTEVGIDLAPGYEGRLVLDGTAIPDDELRVIPEQNQVFFAPGPDRTFESLPEGLTCVTAIVWKSADGPGTDSQLSFRWCFNVT